MQRFGRDQWIELVSEYKKSGLTQKDFAARHQVSYNSLQFWLYKHDPWRPGRAYGSTDSAHQHADQREAGGDRRDCPPPRLLARMLRTTHSG